MSSDEVKVKAVPFFFGLRVTRGKLVHISDNFNKPLCNLVIRSNQSSWHTMEAPTCKRCLKRFETSGLWASRRD